jgi:hypothetical protein
MHRTICETLENRRLLSAKTALIAVWGETLHVYGTDGQDAIHVDAGDYGVDAEDQRVFGNFDGDPFDMTLPSGTFDTVYVEGKDGNDYVGLYGVLPEGGSAYAGAGDDYVLIAGGNISRHLTIDGGVGDDELVLRDSKVEGITLRGRNGDDDMVVSNALVTNYLSVLGEHGNDSLSIADTTVFGFAYGSGGGGGHDVLTLDNPDFRGGSYFSLFDEKIFA